MTKYFYNTISEETAHVVENYPWGFNLRTSVRFWIESNKRGSRFMKRTLNPKTGRWCAVKKSTYSPVMILAEYGTEGGVRTSYSSLEMSHDVEKTEAFRAKHWEGLDALRRAAFLEHLAMARVMEKVTFTIKPSPLGPINLFSSDPVEKAKLAAQCELEAANKVRQSENIKNINQAISLELHGLKEEV